MDKSIEEGEKKKKLSFRGKEAILEKWNIFILEKYKMFTYMLIKALKQFMSTFRSLRKQREN